MKKLILSIASLFLAFAAQAAGSSTGLVTQMVNINSAVIFKSGGTVTGQPGCVTQAGEFAVDATTAVGQQMAASLRAAYALGKTVTFQGSNTCTLNPGYEGVGWILVFP